MKISKQELVKMGACIGGLKRFIKQVNGSDGEVDVLRLIGGENTTSDLLWLASKTLSKDKIVAFACDVALINIDKIKQYTDDFDLIVESLKSRKLTSDAAVAVDAAVDAVDADYGADYAVIECVNAVNAVYAAVAADAAVTAATLAVAVAANAVAADAAVATLAVAAVAAVAADAAVAAVAADAVYADKINELLIKLFSK